MNRHLLRSTLLVAALATLWVCHAQTASTPRGERHEGWSGPESLKHTADWAQQQPKFELTHPDNGAPVWQDNLRARRCQWDALKAANRGAMPPNIPQPVGDCSSRGAAHALERTIAAQSHTFRRVAPHWLYGAGREWSGKGIFRRIGDGCNVAFMAQAARDYGILFQDDPGVPAYDARTIRAWGHSGPPDSLKPLAAERCVRRVALLSTVSDVRDAVCNDYGVATGGRWGTSDGNRGMYQRDGRWFARRDSSWAHVVCIDGYDGSAPSGPCYHVTNSWGEQRFPQPIDGSPAGGYWVTAADIEFMVRDNDTWAFSDVDGFPARIDLSPLRPKKPVPAGAPAVRPNPRLQPQALSSKGLAL